VVGSIDANGGILIRDRTRWVQFLDFRKVLRQRGPGERLYVILDNFSPHLRAEVSDWCSTNNVGSPTN
jgi:hypothetical protein